MEVSIIISIFAPNYKAMEEKRYPILDEDLEKLDWDKFPSFGPFSEEEAIARIDKFEEELANGEVKWIRIDDIHAELKKRHPWL